MLKNKTTAPRRDPSLDSIKGALILLIVIGHAKALIDNPLSFPVINAINVFHIAGFFLLPFLAPPMAWTKTNVFKSALRYIYPFFVFLTFYAIVYHFAFGQATSALAALKNYGAAILIAGTEKFEAACNLKMLWFLPAFFALTLTRSFLAAHPRGATPFLIVALIVHVSVGEMGPWRYDVPWGLLVFSFFYPLGLLAPRIVALGKIFSKILFPSLFAILFGSLCVIPFEFYPGDLNLYGFSNPLRLLLADATILTAFASLVLYKDKLANVPMLSLCGTYSLSLYLIHPMLLQALRILPPLLSEPWYVAAPITLAAALALTGMIAIFARTFPRLYGFFFPRSLADLSFKKD